MMRVDAKSVSAPFSATHRLTHRDGNNINDALREVMQEIALAGLVRAGFFDKAAFYGGTCLRIFHSPRSRIQGRP